MVTSYSSNWIMLLLLCTSVQLVLCCDQFNLGSRRVKRDRVDLVAEDYDITLRWQTVFLSCRGIQCIFRKLPNID